LSLKERVMRSIDKKNTAAALALSALALSGAATAQPFTEGRTFLQGNAAAPGVIVMPGFQYKILKSGPAGAPTAQRSDEITFHYEVSLLDGTVIDSSFKRGEPLVAPLTKLVPGGQIAFQMMRPGDEWLIYFPPEMAYGLTDHGPIPGGSTLVFRGQLISAKPQAAAPPPS
jgi:FKBP-type peptidyl-prolyl cis-trans isomerase